MADIDIIVKNGMALALLIALTGFLFSFSKVARSFLYLFSGIYLLIAVIFNNKDFAIILFHSNNFLFDIYKLLSHNHTLSFAIIGIMVFFMNAAKSLTDREIVFPLIAENKSFLVAYILLSILMGLLVIFVFISMFKNITLS